MFDVCACVWSALWGILETGLSSGFLWGGGELELAWEVWWCAAEPTELGWDCSLFWIFNLYAAF